MKNYFKIMIMCLMGLQVMSCNNFLDVIPDNIANLDQTFSNKKTAESFLATLYSYAPTVHSEYARTLTFFGGDDVWTYDYSNNYDITPGIRIARGEQNINSPYENYWDGKMFEAIRNCNTFIEKMSKLECVPELDATVRRRWLGEANFLKAYYNFILFRMYGPIPIIDKNLPISSSEQEVAVKRAPVDSVVNYISQLLDTAANNLPLVIENTAEEAGRVTKGAALMLKAKLWVVAASPLFNGNADYNGFVDHDGVLLFPQTYDAEKWSKAVSACEDALNNIPGVSLYHFKDVSGLHDPTQYQMNLRGAVTDRFNSEIIWGRYMSPYQNIVMQAEASVPHMISGVSNGYQSSCFSVTLNMVERFYTKNGVPIEEDKTWPYADRYNVAKVGEDQAYNLIAGYSTALLNQYRENRFYASLMFDGSVVYMKNTPLEQNAHQIRARLTDENGIAGSSDWKTVTGYWIRKLINWEYSHSSSGTNTRSYSWPEMRLSDLKLLYAEALNEVNRREEAIQQLDEIRARVGLKGVIESWSQYSINPNKPNTQDGLRKIIHQEREIELAFEGSRLWDLKRWKEANNYLNKDVRGWNLNGKTDKEYYQVNRVYEQKFISPRDYLWPISLNALLRNSNLVQNPGW